MFKLKPIKLNGHKLYAQEWNALVKAFNELIDKLYEGLFIPDNISWFNNDKGYITEHLDISNLATKEELNNKIGNLGNVSENVLHTVKSYVDKKIEGVIGAAPETLDTLEEISLILNEDTDLNAIVTELGKKANSADLANVASSGSYDDLENKPHIPNDLVQVDWNLNDSEEIDYIKNKPELGTASSKDVPKSGNASSSQVVMGNDSRLSDSRSASDVYSWAKLPNKPSYDKSEVGLDKVGNFKAVSTKANQELTDTEKSNARTNIGAGTSSLIIGTSTGNAADGKVVDDHIKNTSNPHSVTKSQIGLDNVTNDAQVKRTEMGANNGVATLGADGKIPSSLLPGAVDDVIDLLNVTNMAPATCTKDDKYYNTSSNKIFTATAANTWGSTGETPESDKIYVNISDSKVYRWSGTTLVVISETLALGETSSTAYRGDRGKIAYLHATDSNRLTTAKDSKLYKIATTSEGHIKSVEEAQKSDITALGIPGFNDAVTEASKHYTPEADNNSELISTLEGTEGAYASDTEYSVVTGVKAQRDSKGHIVGVTTSKQKVKDTKTTINGKSGAIGASDIAAVLNAGNQYQGSTYLSYLRFNFAIAGISLSEIPVKDSGRLTFDHPNGQIDLTTEQIESLVGSSDVESICTTLIDGAKASVYISDANGVGYELDAIVTSRAGVFDSQPDDYNLVDVTVKIGGKTLHIVPTSYTYAQIKPSGTRVTPVGLSVYLTNDFVSAKESQTFTSTQKATARTNIGAGTSNLAIGTTTGTAADGKIVSDHINNISNPHGVTKLQVGLSNVGNFKAVSTVANQGLTDTEKENARMNIAAAGIVALQAMYAEIIGRFRTMAEGISALSEELVAENVWKDIMLWGDNMIWPDEESATVVVMNKYNRALGWTAGMGWNDRATWPSR